MQMVDDAGDEKRGGGLLDSDGGWDGYRLDDNRKWDWRGLDSHVPASLWILESFVSTAACTIRLRLYLGSVTAHTTCIACSLCIYPLSYT